MFEKSIDAIAAAYPYQPLSHPDNFKQLLGMISADSRIHDLRWAAYILATVRHESAFTYNPGIEEFGHGAGKPYGVMDPETKQIFYGRGYSQLTWKQQYARFGQVLKLNLMWHPELACEPGPSYQILTAGMIYGMFTGVSLHHFINSDQCNFVEARKIVNSLDCAEQIAGYAEAFLKILQ